MTEQFPKRPKPYPNRAFRRLNCFLPWQCPYRDEHVMIHFDHRI
ncbi:hypothetical protein EYZ11_012499 [Aspergillus tanneri]|uniref:Uncharacterized protein n=1 Tax=Aspergillus tanneri TaxID=1220188 RepID=A0A4S3J279_9EURO|nr:hypothetical protein EYZ11_012499 [Aspergillus tanneri]